MPRQQKPEKQQRKNPKQHKQHKQPKQHKQHKQPKRKQGQWVNFILNGWDPVLKGRVFQKTGGAE